jgi:hypothetical protein
MFRIKRNKTFYILYKYIQKKLKKLYKNKDNKKWISIIFYYKFMKI